MMFWLKAWRAGQDTPLLFPSAAVGKIAPDVFQAELGKKFPSESRDITQDNVLRALRISEPETTENFFGNTSATALFLWTEPVHLLRAELSVGKVPKRKPEALLNLRFGAENAQGWDSRRDLLLKSIPGWILAFPAAHHSPPFPQCPAGSKRITGKPGCVFHKEKKSSFPPLFLRIFTWL